MALIQCDFYSEVLRLSSTMNVILPQETHSQIGMEGKVTGGKHPTLYLLHGLSDDHSIWLRRTSIERYAAEYGIAVVMPAAHRSFYTDMKQGGDYFKFVSEELPQLAESFFPLSNRREDRFVAGLSMGGYGALKLGLRLPDRYAAAASLSGATDASALFERGDVAYTQELERIFGTVEELRGSDNDLFYLAEQLASDKSKQAPQLYQCCGTEDFLYDHNIRFRDHVNGLGLQLTYEEEPGEHEWGYWDTKIQRVLEWLPLRKSI
ncbi:alpha/beta hydrolase family protein [Paenibacillus kyungheensis]|uniref:Alpha/beta hydrolase family protein n=1 Tax=Paenibacillus kyungheensis TaxID=1452732 RepID=A0AAX3LY17_9BACL|nr:alpha/beta hydrolase family protein [Paenibacillus kyungheensis]WCT54799.1 alpha/beta hydrolase family protein [Paenibacillus kyungheensis]